jgi:hypothetical protein
VSEEGRAGSTAAASPLLEDAVARPRLGSFGGGAERVEGCTFPREAGRRELGEESEVEVVARLRMAQCIDLPGWM